MQETTKQEADSLRCAHYVPPSVLRTEVTVKILIAKNNHIHNSRNKESQHQLAGKDEESLANNWFAMKNT